MEKLFEMLPYEIRQEIFNHFRNLYQKDICKTCYLKKECKLATNLFSINDNGYINGCSDCGSFFYCFEGKGKRYLMHICDIEERDPLFYCHECGIGLCF